MITTLSSPLQHGIFLGEVEIIVPGEIDNRRFVRQVQLVDNDSIFLAGKTGLLAPEGAELAGPGLSGLCKTLDIPPDLHFEKAVAIGALLRQLRQFGAANSESGHDNQTVEYIGYLRMIGQPHFPNNFIARRAIFR